MTEATLAEQVHKLLLVEHFDDAARDRLRDLGPDALAELRACATGSDRRLAGVMKARAISALATWPEPEALDALTTALDDRRLDTRLRAAGALAHRSEPGAVAALASRAARADGVELTTIARSLASIDLPDAADELRRIRRRATASVRREIDDTIGA